MGLEFKTEGDGLAYLVLRVDAKGAPFIGNVGKMSKVHLTFPTPFLMPVLVGLLYGPINERWTVKRFGCGCPPLDLSWRFNANHFNMILWGIVAICCIVLWCLQVARAFGDRSAEWRFLWGFFGSLGIVVICLKFFSQGFWL